MAAFAICGLVLACAASAKPTLSEIASPAGVYELAALTTLPARAALPAPKPVAVAKQMPKIEVAALESDLWLEADLMLAQNGISPLQGRNDDDASAAARQALRPVFASIRVNTLPVADTLLLRDDVGRWLATAEDLQDWRLTAPLPPPDKQFRGQSFYYVDRYPGLAARYDAVRQIVEFDFAPVAFVGGALVVDERRATPPTRPGYGAYLNYDVLASGDRLGYGDSSNPFVNALGETVFYSPYGRLENTFSVTDITRQQSFAPGQSRLSRLNTTWTTDFAARRESLVIGDITGSSGIGGSPLRMGGIRFGSDFSTEPGFITSPVLSFSGQTASPSVVDLFIDGVRARQLQIPTGAFSINEIPVLNGQGEAQLIVTDALGRQQVFTQSFINSARLLRKGLDEYSFELGKLRQFSGFSGDRYDDAAGVIQWRRGVTNSFTMESRLSASETIRNAGSALTFGSRALGAYSLGVAASEGGRNAGELASISAQQVFFRRFSLSGSAQWTTSGYRQVGSEGLSAPAVRTYAVAGGLNLPGGFNTSLGYVAQEPRDRVKATSLTARISRSFGKLFVSANAALNRAEAIDKVLFINAGYSFGSRIYGSASTTRTRPETGPSRWAARTQVQRSLGNEEAGVGWSVRADGGRRDGGVSEPIGSGAGLIWNASKLSMSADLAHTERNNAWRAGFAGAVGILDTQPFVSRRVSRSLAYLDEPLLAGLPVIVNSQKAVVLDRNGRGVLPQLQPYSRNEIRVDLSTSDYDLTVSEPETYLVPAARAGYRVSLGAERQYGAILVLVDARDGKPVAPATRVSIETAPEEAYVADRGEAYVVSRKTGRLRVKVSGSKHVCEFEIDMPDSGSTLPQLGPIPCASTSR